MLGALVGALLPVVIGVGLGATPLVAHEVLHRARGIGLVVTVGAVLLVLLPASWAHLGAWSLVVLLAGLVTPTLIERVAGALPGAGRFGERVADELAFVGIALHQLADGLQVGASFAGGTGFSVAATIALHSIPLVAALTLRYAADDHATLWPRAAALLGATGLGAIAGFGLAERIPGEAAWLPALVGGLLLHVLWHDFPRHVHRHD